MDYAEDVTFAEAYRPLWEPLPASQRREAVRRLTSRRKDPIPVESLGEEHPVIEECLKRLAEAYLRKKQRCAAASARRRQAMKAAAAAAESVEPEPAVAEVAVVVAESAVEPEPAVAEVVAECAVEPEPAPEPAPAAVEPIPAPSRLRRRESDASGSPKPRVPKPRVPKPVPVPEPAQPQPQKADARTLLRKRTPRQDGEAAKPSARAAGRPLIVRR